jgi:hypothetical protein
MEGSDNVKLPLCLTKYHIIKTYLSLNYAPHNEDVLGSVGTAPRILAYIAFSWSDLRNQRKPQLMIPRIRVQIRTPNTPKTKRKC